MISKNDKIFVSGHGGLIGSALVRNLEAKGYTNIVVRTRKELDLLNTDSVTNFYKEQKPDVVIHAAAKVGGILANDTQGADFIYQNLVMQNNVIWGAYQAGVKKLIFLGSSCIYPRLAEQPMAESCLLTGSLEPTNRPYAIAKISGLEMVNALRRQHDLPYFSVMPINLYGVNDNYHALDSHVFPALIRRIAEAKENKDKEVVVWGTGNALREFMFSDDCADAIVFLLENLKKDSFGDSRFSHVNIGSGQEVSILELTKLMAKVIGYQGNIVQDLSKPDGAPRKLLDNSFLANLGWKAKTPLEDGIRATYEWYVTAKTVRK